MVDDAAEQGRPPPRRRQVTGRVEALDVGDLGAHAEVDADEAEHGAGQVDREHGADHRVVCMWSP